MQKAVTVLALATVGLAFDDVNSRFPYDPERITKGFDDVSSRIAYQGERLNVGFDDISSRTVYQPQFVDPMIFKPKGDMDPLILVRPKNNNIDPKMILRPTTKPTVTYADDEELNVLKSIGNGLKKAGKFVINHPQVITIPAKLLLLDDEEDQELFNIHQVEEEVKNAGKFLVQNPEVIKQAEQKAQEIIHRYAHNKDLLKQDAKKAVDYISQHPELIKEAIEAIKSLHYDDEELFNLGGLIKDGVNIYKDVKNKDYGNLVNHGIQTVKDIKRHDDELFLGKGAKYIIEKGQERTQAYISVIKAGKDLVQNIRNQRNAFVFADDENDNELSSLSHLINEVKEKKSESNTHSTNNNNKKKLVTFDEVDIENAHFFEDNDLMCVSLKIAGMPFKYCK